MEAERSRADDYYLAEGTGFAERYTATADGQVRVLPQLDGDTYEAWVGGVDPETGVVRGRVRGDEHALRFAEVVVNGPKSWSIAAELHPDIAAAYAGAQTRAAAEIVAYFGQSATTRVGPRGAQISTPVTRIEAVAVAHHTSRAGDPHRHIHLQINARVQAAGGWRGIDSVAVRNSIKAVHGIGHAAVMTDPAFRQALAAHGFSLDAESGEVVELTGFVAPFSKRATQISDQVAGYETEWRAANPDRVPGPALRRAWDARAWAEHRPDKTPAGGVPDGQVVHERWLTELEALGYQTPVGPVDLVAAPVGGLDRDAAAAEVLARLTAAGSAWNAADIRGEAELLIAREGVIVEPAARVELAEDLTARAAMTVRPLPGLEARATEMPAHIRTLTSPEAIAVQAELGDRLAGRAAADAVGGSDATPEQITAAAGAAGVRLDAAQAEAAAALAGSHSLVLVTGAAGAGKTTTLATTRTALEAQGHRLLVVTPTLKAAKGARVETGAQAGTVAWLVHQYGWRRDDAARWTRLTPGDADTGRWARAGATYQGPREDAQLAAGDLVVVDEAGMLDQDTTRTLLQVADEAQVRVALVGDAHQLPAIGRGGVLELAERWTQRAVTLDVIHRFVHTVQIEPGIYADVDDTAYAALSLRMRDGAAGDPGAVFDELTARGQVVVHAGEDARRQAVAAVAAAAVRAGRTSAVSVATNEAAAELNAAIRDQLITTGHVDDGGTGDNAGGRVATTGAGQRVGVGDLVVTRDNNRGLDVANRDTFTVTAVNEDGSITVTPTAGATPGATPPVAGGVASVRVLPPGYVNRHVQLGYAGTIHSVQGQTAHTGVLVLDEHTSVQAAYVGMTRGRTANTVHLVAADLEAARAQWIEVAGRGRADLGLEAARAAAEREAAPYAGVAAPVSSSPVFDSVSEADQQAVAQALTAAQAAARALDRSEQQRPELVSVLEQLCAAWTEQARAREQLARLEPRLAAAQADQVWRAEAERVLTPLRQTMNDTRAAALEAEAAAGPAREALAVRTDQIRDQLQTRWETDVATAATAARVVAAGTGTFGRGRDKVRTAQLQVADWQQQWRPVLAQIPGQLADPVMLSAGWHREPLFEALDQQAHQQAAAQAPQLVQLVQAGDKANTTASEAATAYTQARSELSQQQGVRHAARGWRNLAEELPRLTQAVEGARDRLTYADTRVEQLTSDPVITGRPAPANLLTNTHSAWELADTAAQAAAQQRSRLANAHAVDAAARGRMQHAHEHDQPHYGPDHDRGGPSFGR